VERDVSGDLMSRNLPARPNDEANGFEGIGLHDRRRSRVAQFLAKRPQVRDFSWLGMMHRHSDHPFGLKWCGALPPSVLLRVPFSGGRLI
jgi:hypothetical protein